MTAMASLGWPHGVIMENVEHPSARPPVHLSGRVAIRCNVAPLHGPKSTIDASPTHTTLPTHAHVERFLRINTSSNGPHTGSARGSEPVGLVCCCCSRHLPNTPRDHPIQFDAVDNSSRAKQEGESGDTASDNGRPPRKRKTAGAWETRQFRGRVGPKHVNR